MNVHPIFIILIAIIFLAIHTPAFGQCSIPNSLLKIKQPSVELIQRFKHYKKDSLDLEKNQDCILKFYNEYAYCLRRMDQDTLALHLIDSILEKHSFANKAFLKSCFQVEKAAVVINYANNTELEALLKQIKTSIENNNFFEAYEDREMVLDLISISISIYSEATDFEFANNLLSKQLDLNIEQDSFIFFHNNFLIGLNNFNDQSFHKALEDLQKAEKLSHVEGVNMPILAELYVLLGSTLVELDQYKEANEYFHKALDADKEKIGINLYASIGLAKSYNKLGMQDSVLKIKGRLSDLSYSNTLPRKLDRDVLQYLLLGDFYGRDKAGFGKTALKLESTLDTADLEYDKYVHYRTQLMNNVLNRFNKAEYDDYLTYRSLNFKIRDRDQLQIMNSLKAKYDLEKTEAKNALLKADNQIAEAKIEQDKVNKWLLAALALAIAALAGLFFYRMRFYREKKRIVEMEKQQLASENENLNIDNKAKTAQNKKLAQEIATIQALNKELEHKSKRPLSSYQNEVLTIDNKYKKQVTYQQITKIYTDKTIDYIVFDFPTDNKEERNVYNSSLKAYKKSLPDGLFIQPNQQTLIYRYAIDRYEKGKLFLKNGETLKVSRHYQPEVLKMLNMR